MRSGVPAVDRRLDLLVIGSGLAGLTAAHEAAVAGARVAVVTKGACRDGASSCAQGGIAVPCGVDDVASHVEDTLKAGRGLCEVAAVQAIVGEGMVAERWLRSAGVEFDAERAREGGHCRARIMHCEGDRTGAHIMASVGRQLSTLRHGPVVLEGHRALALCKRGDAVTGVLLQPPEGADPFILEAGGVILASGGLGQLYARTTNPLGACGEGVALALMAGAVVRDMEFVQFHPTALPDGSLVTEAVRGAGARLINARGEYFMPQYDPAADLAPRDVVARAVFREGAASGGVRLDLRPVAGLSAKFPDLVERLRASGYRPLQEPVPVAPAAHYAVGGVRTDLFGRTSVPGLYAAGEVASTGLHGANRLASNSMLEAWVMGRRAAHAALSDLRPAARRGAPLPVRGLEAGAISWLPQAMAACAGVQRDDSALRTLEGRLGAAWERSVETFIGVEFVQQVLTAALIARGARLRKETCGTHWRSDGLGESACPYHLEQWWEPENGPGPGIRDWRHRRVDGDMSQIKPQPGRAA